MLAKFKYFTIINDERREFHPSNIKPLQTVYTRVDDLRYSHSVSLPHKFTLNKDDFTYIFGIETSNSRCGDIRVEIEKLCNNVYSLFAEGVLRVVDGEYDTDLCKVEINITAIDPHYCYDYNKKREIDIFEAKPYNERVKAEVLRGTVEVFIHEGEDDETLDPYNPALFDGKDPRTLGWVVFRNEAWNYGPNTPRGDGSQKHQFKTYYAREKIVISSSDPDPGAGWIFISEDGGDKTYARSVVRANYQRLLPNNYDPDGDIQPTPIRNFTEMPQDSLLFAYDVMGYQGVPSNFDNGILLSDLLTYFISKYCGIAVKSNFFQINADMTFAEAYTQLPDDKRTTTNIIFQKSDVKRLNASNNATKGITTLEKLIDNICLMYNLQYRIEDGYFNIEHVSFWEKSVELDLTAEKYEKYLLGTNKYSYEQDKLPQFEQFKMMEQGYPDFKGVPIEYFGRCVSVDEADKVKNREVPIITTDVEYCMENNGGDSNLVSDEGFVIMATVYEDGVYYIQRFNPILDEYSKVNNPLSWAHLINAFYKHERPQAVGLMNHIFQNFFTTAPVRKQPTISIPFCCGDELKLTGLVKTKLGEGVIQSAKLNHYTELLELDLLYINPNQEVFCTPPTYFGINRVTETRFYFDATFLDCTINHRLIIEVTLPNGDVYNTDEIVMSCNDTISIPLEGAPGIYKFRARQVCDAAISEWTPFVNVDYVNPTLCDMLPAYSFVNRKTTATFVFQFSASGFTDAVDGEITIPSGAVTKQNNLTVNQLSGVVQIEWNITGTSTPVRLFPGTYKFRFRRRCGSNTTGLYGSQINVTI